MAECPIYVKEVTGHPNGLKNHNLPDLSSFTDKTHIKMKITYPHKIQNCIGETLIFKEVQHEPDGDRLVVENYVEPGIGPVMHTHWLQDECLTVVKGRLGYEIQGQPKQYVNEGETILFERGVAHRFWNAGEDILHCQGWVKPANTLAFSSRRAGIIVKNLTRRLPSITSMW